jgi:hypothetical protein
MNHNLVHQNTTDEFDAIWEAITHLENDTKEHLRQIEAIRSLIQDGLIRINIKDIEEDQHAIKRPVYP